MKLHEYAPRQLNVISAYRTGRISIGGRHFEAPLILAPAALHAEWIASQSQLDLASLAPLWATEPRIVLLGGSPLDVAIARALRPEFARRGAALEAMDLGAACRTYNVLAQEDRAVAALLFP